MSERRSATAALVAIGQELELWHDADGEAYVTVGGDDGHAEHHALRSRAVRSYLAGTYYRRHASSARRDAITEALDTLEGLARYEGEQHTVAVRLGALDGAIYLDLGDAAWRAVEVTAGGWRVVDRPPVRFRRPRGLRALPEPVRGGSLAELRAVLPAVQDEDLCLLVAWLLAALRPVGPYPVLCLHGEAGAAKSTTGRILRGLVDPALAPLRSAPRDDHDLVIAASNGHVVALDNLSHVQPWLSDALRALRAINVRPRKLYATRHTFITLALNRPGVNLKWLADYCGTSLEMIEKHYSKSLAADATQLAVLHTPAVRPLPQAQVA